MDAVVVEPKNTEDSDHKPQPPTPAATAATDQQQMNATSAESTVVLGPNTSTPIPDALTKPPLVPAVTQKSVSWKADLTTEATVESNGYNGSYVRDSSVNSNNKNTLETVKDVLGRWGKRVGEATRKGQDLTGNMWQHLKTGPSLTEAAIGRIAQGTKVLAEGGYDKIFQQTFETLPEEKLISSYACYLSTSAGPVMGVLYISNDKLAYCSDNPLSYKVGDKTEWSYYKVVIPLSQLRAVNPSDSKLNRAEKYVQVVSVDNHEFWFMGFVNYDGAVSTLQEALQYATGSEPS